MNNTGNEPVKKPSRRPKVYTGMFERLEISMTLAQAKRAYHMGACDNDVAKMSRRPSIREQLDKLSVEAVKEELEGYGAWDEEELSSHEDNLQRILWMAAGNILDELAEAKRNKGLGR